MTDTLDTAGAVASYLSSETTPAQLGAQARYSMANAVGGNPTYEAELRGVAQRTGVPADTVRAYPDELKKQATLGAYDFDQMATEFPNATKFLTDQGNADVGHNDVGTLKTIEQGFGSLLKWAMGNGSSTIGGDVAAAYHAASGGAAGAFGAVTRTVGAPLGFLEDFQSIGGNPLFRLSEGFMRIADREAAAQKAATGKSDTWLGGAFSSGVQSLAQNVPTMALALLPGGQGAALAAMGITTGGQSYQKGMAAGDRSHWQSLLHGVSDATIEVGTEMGPLHGLVDNIKAGTPLFTTMLKNAWQENKGEQVATALQDLNDWAVNDVNKGKTFVDYLKERPEAAAQTAIATLVGTGGNVAIMHGIQTAVDQTQGRNRQLEYLSRQAEQHAQVLEGLQTTMQASEILKHSPETLTAYMQGLADQGAPNVYVDSAKLVEAGIDLQALAQVVPSIASQLDQVQSGGDLVIPTAELLAGTIGGEFAQPLIDNARTDVNGMSRTEAKVYMQEQGDHINAEVERVMAEKANDTEFKAGRDQVQAQLLTDLNEVKRFTPKVNEHYATLAANFYAVMAARTGMTVQQFADTYKLGFSGNTTAGAGMYDQGSKLATESAAFKGWFGDSKVVDAGGKPLVVYHGTSASEKGEAFTSFDTYGSNHGLFGQGQYFTDDSSVASSYTSKGRGDAPTVYPVYVKVANPIDMDKPVRQAELVAWQKAFPEVDFANTDYTPKGDRPNGLINEDFYRIVEEHATDQEMLKWEAAEMIQDGLRNMGHDGITHIGGGRVKSEGVKHRVVIAFDPEQIKSATGNRGTFNPKDANILNQDARGQISFADDITQQASIIAMMKGADLSTFIHEGGHFFLEVQADLATRIAGRMAHGEQVSDGERAIVDDFNTTLDWMGVKGSPELSAIETWYLMSADEKRQHHEQWARGFEAYAFEGESPSMELTKMFQTFRAWLVNVYRAMLKSVNASKTDIAGAMNVELSDEVRAVMDRMLATSEQIAEAEAARNMGPLFQTPEEAGMDLEAYKLYHDMGTQSTLDAVDELQAKGLRDMQWLSNARSRKLEELQKQHDALRAQIAQEVKAEVLSQPIYRAWTFLTAKGGDKVVGDKPAGQSKGVNPEVDNLFTAIAKLGGLDRLEVKKLWGIDEKEKLDSGVFGSPVVRKTGGVSLDVMGQRLIEEGYLLPDQDGNYYPEKLEALFDDQRRGTDRYSIKRDMAAAYGDAPVDLPHMPDFAAGKLCTEDLRYMYGTKDDAVWRKLSELRMTSDGTGLHPEVVAELFEFSSADELVRALADAEPPKSVIEGRTDQRMLQEHGDLATPSGLERAADMAIHNDARVRFVATELRALQHAMSVREKVPGKKHTVDVLVQAAKEHASAVIARLKVRDIRPGQYAAAEVRAAKAAVAAKGDLPKQAEHKRNQLINLYAAKAAYAAQEEIKKAITYFKKFDSASVRAKLPGDYVGQIDMLLEKFDLRAQSGVAVDRTKTLRTWVQSRLNAGEIPNISEQLLTPEDRKAYSAAINARDDEGNLVYPDDDERIKLLADAIERSTKRSIKDMTVEEVRGLRETIQQIEHLGRLKDKMLTKMEGEGYAATRDLLTATVVANAKEQGKNTRTDNTWLGGKLDGLKQFGASHIKPAIWMRIFDGGQDNGPWWSTIVRPANERASFETSRRAEATSKLMEILGPVLKDVPHLDKIGKGKFFPALNTSLNWEERMAFAFNYGNESNLQRLMGGGIAGVTKALTMGQVQTVLNTLSAAEWTAVQGVWDHFESYRPEIGAKELRVNGVEPVWIDARPFTIKTSDGKMLELRGGYYPVKFDAKTSLKAQQHSDSQASKDAMKAAYSVATTQRSFTKERVEEVTGRPLLLNLQGLYSGVNDVIHDLAWHEWVIDVNRLLRSDSIDAAIREHYGANVKRELTKWRDDIVAGSARLDHGIENAAGWARKFVSSAALTYNVISALMQPLGITQSFARVGTEWVGLGLGQYLGGPREATRMVQGKSEYMTSRTRTMFRDINELRNRVQGQTTGRELMGRYGYFLTMHFQMMVDVPTWIGAYEKGLAGGFDDKTAVALADQSVKDSQGGGEEVDQSGITRGGPMIKLFTAFYDFMNTQANVLYLKNATAENKADKFMHVAVVGLVTPVLAAALRDALIAGDSGDWDDWEKIVKKMLAEGLGNLIGMMAFGREFGPALKAVMGDDKGMGYSGPAGIRVIPDAIKLAKQVSQGELDDAFRKSLINAVGDVAGIPAVQINRTITGIEALDEGKTSNPAAVVTGYQEPH